MSKRKTDDSADWTSLKRGSVSKNSRRKPISWRARFRALWLWTRRAAFVAASGAACFGAYYAYQNLYFDEIFGTASSQIRHIEMKTDGAISGTWMNGYLKIPRGSKLADVNIFAVKQAIDALSQIKSSKVERVYPDVLRITISERFPVAKIALKIDYETRTYLMDGDGSFFLPICIPQETIDSLKFVEGVKISFDGDVPSPYPGAKKICEFLGAIESRLPEELKNWASIDVSQLYSRTLPLITAVSRGGTKIVFKPEEYPRQLDRLEYIMKYMRENPHSKIEKIDLTLSDWSVVKFENQQPKEK